MTPNNMHYHLEAAIRALEGALDTTDPEVHKKRELGDREFRYVPLSPTHFLGQLTEAVKAVEARKIKFIDVGCGIGTKVLLAREVLKASGGDAFGIEKFPPYVEIARRVLMTYGFRQEPVKSDNEVIIKGDAIAHSYAPYNLIYFYCPIIDYKKQVELEERIVKTCRVGTVIMPNGSKSEAFYKAGGPLKRITNTNVWRKVRQL